jgi:hypothetical protein
MMLVRGPQARHLSLEETPWYVKECVAVPTCSICGAHKEVDTEASSLKTSNIPAVSSSTCSRIKSKMYQW